MPSPRNLSDILSGIALILTAGVGLYLAMPLDAYSSFGLGPGYIPKALAWLLAGLGASIALHGFLTAGPQMEPWHLRPLFFVLASIAFFGLTVERMGLVVAVVGLVLIASAAQRRPAWTEAAGLAVFAAIFSVLVFIKALGLTMPAWPQLQWVQ